MSCFVSMAGRALKNFLRLSTFHGQQGMAFTKAVKKGTLLGICKAESVVPEPNKYTVEIKSQVHGRFPDLDFLNHCCSPNLKLEVSSSPDDTAEISAWTVRDVAEGEQATFHYCTTEKAMDEPFECFCIFGASNRPRTCLGTVKGYDFLTEAQKADIDHLVSTEWKNS
uniref:SET domain-containing protein n=1 Tax=Palpitomonas bilix TaxID=652834 RepID=A0A7S3CYJ4_9EUKA